MAITIIQKPDNYHSAYNPIKFELDSTNKNQSGFRYIVEIYDTGTTNKLAEFDVAPDPFNNGKADIDLSRVIQNKVDTFITFTSNTVNNAVSTYYKYDVKFGESYNSTWNFNDYVFLSGDTLGLTTDTIYGTGFTNTTHNFIIGSQIYVQMNSIYGDNRDLLNGYWVVTEVPSNKTIGINITFSQIGSGPASPGVARFSDFQKVRVYNLNSTTGITAVNVAQDILEYSTLNGSLNGYILTGATQQLLTNLPEKFFVTPEQTMFLNMLEANSTGFVYFENDGGDILRKSNSGTHIVKSNGIGPDNLGTLSTISGTTPLIKSTTKYYDVWVTNSTGTQQSEKLRINIDRRCKISDVEILFMDRKGSYISFPFQNRRYENITTEKQNYRQYVKNYNTYSKGLTSYHSKYMKELNLNTNFMTEEMNLYFEELLTSRYTYVKWEGVWYACVVEDGQYQNEFEINNTLIKKNITVRFAIDSPVN
jgi:hypothetical protein